MFHQIKSLKANIRLVLNYYFLLIIGLILIALLIGAMIPSEVAYIGTSKGSIVISILLGLFSLAVIIGATYGVTRLVVRQPITFKKVLSDYVLINSVTVAVLLISIILFLRILIVLRQQYLYYQSYY